MRIGDGFLLWVLHDGVMVWRINYVAHRFFTVVGYSCLPCNRFLLLGFDFHCNLCSITAMDRELCEAKRSYVKNYETYLSSEQANEKVCTRILVGSAFSFLYHYFMLLSLNYIQSA